MDDANSNHIVLDFEESVRLKAILKQDSLGIAIIDSITGKFKEVNVKFAQLLGRSVEEIVELNWKQITHPDDLQKELQNIQSLNQDSTKTIEMEKRFIHADKSIVWVNVSLSSFFIENTKHLHHICTIEELISQKQANKELNNQLKFLDNIIEFSPNSMWISDAEGTLIKMNQACRNTLHLRDEEVIGKYNILQDNIVDAQGLMPLVRNVFEKGEKTRFTISYETALVNGLDLNENISVMLDVSISPILDETGKVTNAIIQHIDITERKQIEDALAESELEFKQLFENMMTGLFVIEVIFDESGNPIDYFFVKGNPAFERMIGISSKDYVGKTSEFFPVKWPQKILESFYEVAITGKPVQYERYNESLNRWFETQVFSPKKGQFAHIFTDITDRKFLEEQMRSLLQAVDQSPATVVITDLTGKIEYVNQKFTDTTGYSFAEAIGVNPRILKSGEMSKDKYSELWKTIMSGQTWYGEFHNKRKNGTLFWEKASIAPIKNVNGEPVKFLAIKENITDRKLTEDALLYASEQLERTSILAKVGGWELDLKTNVLLWTKETYRIHEVDFLYQPTLTMGINFYPPEVRSTVETFVNTGIEQGTSWEYELPLITAKGRRIWVKEQGFAVKEGDDIIKLTGTVQDITDRKTAEEQYSTLFNLSPLPMWLFELENYRFIRVNKAAIDHYGYSEEEFLSMTVMDLKLENQIAKSKKIIDSPKMLTDKIVTSRSVHRKKNGELIDVEIYATTTILKDVRISSVIAIDVTEKNKIEHIINKAILKTQEEERYEIGGELHDNVSQILVASQLSLGMIKKNIDPTQLEWFNQGRGYITLALEEIRNLSHRLSPVFFEDKTLEDAFTILLNTMNPEGKYTVKISFDDEIKKKNISQELQLNLYRILQEQSKNILKHSKATLVEVDVFLVNENTLTMRILDNGIGFNVDTVKKGIGLTNIKKRTESFSGNLQIETSPGNGCIILLDIPLNISN